MPKKKLSNRMTPFQRKKLYAELARYKSGAPINDLAKRHGVSTGTVNHWWKRVKADRKQNSAGETVRMIKPLERTGEIPASEFRKRVSRAVERNYDVYWWDSKRQPRPRIDIEALIRDETRKYLDEVFRKA